MPQFEPSGYEMVTMGAGQASMPTSLFKFPLYFIWNFGFWLRPSQVNLIFKVAYVARATASSTVTSK